ncbi:BTAD domain-containing putative transcriptional regulator, partial [Streptomyces sp. NPDC006355]|uniref:BTAD domain-containing putative transcriptional regulator n=1 Tax=Streptomyces sp. NPDC006355 TaxID=3156758 RepID=UPI0033A48952
MGAASPCSGSDRGSGERYGLRFGLLGPPVLYDDAPGGAARAIGSPKTRVLLAALLLDAGRVVSVESLKDALWGGAPPLSAQASLHNHVARLRRLLGDPERLRTVPSGYVLRVDEGELDVHVFDAHVAAARAAHAGQDWERVVAECGSALALWRGAPLAGLPPEVGGYAFARRLREARLLLLEWRYDAELALGGPRLDGLVPELAALTGEYPLREVYHRQLMLALHRTGRRAEALAVHRDLRTRLIDELGIEPGPGIREAHVEVLRGAKGDGGGAGGRGEGERGSGSPIDPGGPGARPSAGAGPSSSGLRPSAGAGPSSPGLRPSAGAGPSSSGLRPSAGAGPSSSGLRPSAGAGPSSSGLCPSAGAGPSSSGARPSAGAGPSSSGLCPSAGAGPSSPGARPSAGAGPDASHSQAPAGPSPSTPAPTPHSPPPPGPKTPGAQRPARTPAPPPTATPLPAQLPPPPAHFTGRAAEREALGRALTAPTPHPTAVVSGMPGVGKSALALHVAHALAERFPDGQLYLNLHGATPGMTPLTPGQALTALLRDLGTEPGRIPEPPDAAAALLRSLLAPTRTLLVLDDAASAAQVRPLLPGGAGCAVIVTSRSPLTALDGVARFPLAPLSDEESADLLRAASGRAGLDGSDAARLLVELTGRLPLALRVVAARLAARQALTPDVLAGQLVAADDRLRHLEYDDLSVRRSLAVAQDALAASEREVDRDAALTLRRIGALDLPTYGAPLLARLTGTGETRTEAALDRLVDVALLEETAYGRYAPHDLVRDFARERRQAAQCGRRLVPGREDADVPHGQQCGDHQGV